jgi:hypothetical protein
MAAGYSFGRGGRRRRGRAGGLLPPRSTIVVLSSTGCGVTRTASRVPQPLQTSSYPLAVSQSQSPKEGEAAAAAAPMMISALHHMPQYPHGRLRTAGVLSYGRGTVVAEPRSSRRPASGARGAWTGRRAAAAAAPRARRRRGHAACHTAAHCLPANTCHGTACQIKTAVSAVYTRICKPLQPLHVRAHSRYGRYTAVFRWAWVCWK